MAFKIDPVSFVFGLFCGAIIFVIIHYINKKRRYRYRKKPLIIQPGKIKRKQPKKIL